MEDSQPLPSSSNAADGSATVNDTSSSPPVHGEVLTASSEPPSSHEEKMLLDFHPPSASSPTEDSSPALQGDGTSAAAVTGFPQQQPEDSQIAATCGVDEQTIDEDPDVAKSANMRAVKAKKKREKEEKLRAEKEAAEFQAQIERASVELVNFSQAFFEFLELLPRADVPIRKSTSSKANHNGDEEQTEEHSVIIPSFLNLALEAYFARLGILTRGSIGVGGKFLFRLSRHTEVLMNSQDQHLELPIDVVRHIHKFLGLCVVPPPPNYDLCPFDFTFADEIWQEVSVSLVNWLDAIGVSLDTMFDLDHYRQLLSKLSRFPLPRMTNALKRVTKDLLSILLNEIRNPSKAKRNAAHHPSQHGESPRALNDEGIGGASYDEADEDGMMTQPPDLYHQPTIQFDADLDQPNHNTLFTPTCRMGSSHHDDSRLGIIHAQPLGQKLGFSLYERYSPSQSTQQAQRDTLSLQPLRHGVHVAEPMLKGTPFKVVLDASAGGGSSHYLSGARVMPIANPSSRQQPQQRSSFSSSSRGRTGSPILPQQADSSNPPFNDEVRLPLQAPQQQQRHEANHKRGSSSLSNASKRQQEESLHHQEGGSMHRRSTTSTSQDSSSHPARGGVVSSVRSIMRQHLDLSGQPVRHNIPQLRHEEQSLAQALSPDHRLSLTKSIVPADVAKTIALPTSLKRSKSSTGIPSSSTAVLTQGSRIVLPLESSSSSSTVVGDMRSGQEERHPLVKPHIVFTTDVVEKLLTSTPAPSDAHSVLDFLYVERRRRRLYGGGSPATRRSPPSSPQRKRKNSPPPSRGSLRSPPPRELTEKEEIAALEATIQAELLAHPPRRTARMAALQALSASSAATFHRDPTTLSLSEYWDGLNSFYFKLSVLRSANMPPAERDLWKSLREQCEEKLEDVFQLLSVQAKASHEASRGTLRAESHSSLHKGSTTTSTTTKETEEEEQWDQNLREMVVAVTAGAIDDAVDLHVQVMLQDFRQRVRAMSASLLQSRLSSAKGTVFGRDVPSAGGGLTSAGDLQQPPRQPRYMQPIVRKERSSALDKLFEERGPLALEDMKQFMRVSTTPPPPASTAHRSEERRQAPNNNHDNHRTAQLGVSDVTQMSLFGSMSPIPSHRVAQQPQNHHNSATTTNAAGGTAAAESPFLSSPMKGLFAAMRGRTVHRPPSSSVSHEIPTTTTTTRASQKGQNSNESEIGWSSLYVTAAATYRTPHSLATQKQPL